MNIYQHFRTHEHPFIDLVISWMEYVETKYTYYLTDFLDPRQQQIVESLIGSTNEEIRYYFFGGHEQTERKRAIIAPSFIDITKDDFDLTVLVGFFSNNFVKIKHRDVLGAIMSLGIERKKIGDIIVRDNQLYILVTKQLSMYVKMNLTKINNVQVKFTEIAYKNVQPKQEQWLKSHYTISSLRLDVFIKEIFRMSRKDAANYIKRDRVKVNFTNIDDPSIQLIENDLVSVRGFGRSKLIEILGKTRKDKIKIIAAKIKT